MYETFDHTADLGLRVRADDLHATFAEAARALVAAVVDDLDSIQPVDAVEFQLHEEDHALLLFDWLNELLYRFDAEEMLFSRFDVSIEGNDLKATAYGERLDRSRHALTHEVKAITYHGLRLEKEDEGWLAEIIIDI